MALQLDHLYVERFNSTSLASDAQLMHVIALIKPTRLRLGEVFHTQKGVQVLLIVLNSILRCQDLSRYYSVSVLFLFKK